MSLAKLLDLIVHQRLVFSLVSELEDDHEGAITRPMIDDLLRGVEEALRENDWLEEDIVARLNSLPREIQSVAGWFYASSWTIADSESHALWRIFCGGQDGVAVRSTARKLQDLAAKDGELYLSAVTYRDYVAERFSSGNIFYQVASKRREFAYENEVRLLWTPWKELDRMKRLPATRALPVSTVDLVDEVVVGPYALAGLEDVLVTLMSAMNINLPVRRSALANKPWVAWSKSPGATVGLPTSAPRPPSHL